MRHGIAFETGARGPSGTARLKTVVLEWPAAQTTLLDLEGVIDVLVHRREHLEREIVSNVPGSPWDTQVGRLRGLRGVDTLTAVGLCAEVGDFARFARAEQLMSYLGQDADRPPSRTAARGSGGYRVDRTTPAVSHLGPD